MVYAKRANSRKRNSRFRSRRSFKSRGRSLRRSTYKAVKRVAYRVLQKNTEMRFNDLSEQTYQAVSWNGVALDFMQNIVPGDLVESKRQGAKVSCKGLGVRLNLVGNTASNHPMVSYRVIIVRWHNENGIPPGIGNLLAGGGPNRFMSPYLFIPNKNWTIIDDTFVKVGGYSTASAPVGQPNQYLYNKFFKLKHVCTWNADNLVIDGGVYGFIISDEDPAYTYKSVAKWECRLYYKDD